jgi:hypothetical protein
VAKRDPSGLHAACNAGALGSTKLGASSPRAGAEPEKRPGLKSKPSHACSPCDAKLSRSAGHSARKSSARITGASVSKLGSPGGSADHGSATRQRSRTAPCEALALTHASSVSAPSRG